MPIHNEKFHFMLMNNNGGTAEILNKIYQLAMLLGFLVEL